MPLTPGARRGPSRLFIWVCIALGLVGVGELLVYTRLQDGAARRKRIMTTLSARPIDLVLPDSLPMAFVRMGSIPVEQRSFALSPDASKLVYVALDRDTTRLVCLDLRGKSVRVLAGTEGAVGPTFSPDGHTVAFQTETALMKISLEGGPPVLLSRMTEPGGVQWLDADRLIAAERLGRSLVRVRASGGRIDSITATNDLFLNPTITPDGRSLLWAKIGLTSVLDLESGTERVLAKRGIQSLESTNRAERFYGVSPKLLPSQLLLYVEYGPSMRLMGVPVAKGTFEPLGRPVELATDVRVGPGGAVSQYDAANDVLVYVPAAPDVDPQRHERARPRGTSNSRLVDPSPDLAWRLHVIIGLAGVARAGEMAKR